MVIHGGTYSDAPGSVDSIQPGWPLMGMTT